MRKKIHKLNFPITDDITNEEISMYETKKSYFKKEINNFFTNKEFYKTILGKFQKELYSQEKFTTINKTNTPFKDKMNLLLKINNSFN